MVFNPHIRISDDSGDTSSIALSDLLRFLWSLVLSDGSLGGIVLPRARQLR